MYVKVTLLVFNLSITKELRCFTISCKYNVADEDFMKYSHYFVA